jgi:hypothetical protein
MVLTDFIFVKKLQSFNIKEKFAIISVTGPYAAESEGSIYTRKMREIEIKR